MKAFVTGATGFLGTPLIQELDKDGWDITALHRPSSDLRELKKAKHFHSAVGDILDIESLRRGIPEGVDAVFHVAGSVGNLPHSKEGTRYDVNQKGTQNVVQVCLEKNIRRLIYTSTVVTYDFHAMKPVTERAPYNDWSRDPYVHSKTLAEIEVRKAEAQGLDVVYLHPSAMFGAYDKATWSKMFLEIERGLPLPVAPPGGGSVCHSRKVARAHVDAYYKGGKGSHYILGGPDVTWLQVTQAIARLLGKPEPKIALPISLFKIYGRVEFLASTLVHREPMLTPHTVDILSETIFSDSSLAIREINYQPSSLEEMLKECYDWMLEVGMLKKRDSDLESRPALQN